MSWAHFARDLIQLLIFIGVMMLVLTVCAAGIRVIWSDFEKRGKDK